MLPVGNAGNITAYWKGYKEYHEKGVTSRLPRMWGFQAEGAAPIVRGYPIEKPETVATAIRIGNPASWKKAEAARDESGGEIDMVTDEQILDVVNNNSDLQQVTEILIKMANQAGGVDNITAVLARVESV